MLRWPSRFLPVFALQVGRSIANLLAGNGWVFVDRSALFATAAPVLQGQAGAGVEATTPASPALLWTCVIVVELAAAALAIWAVKAALDRWGPGRVRGTATRTQAETVLGRTRLRKHARIIRPDLYGAPKDPAR